MATVVNDRDVLLLGILPSQRQSNPAGSTILLTTNSSTFHVSTDGVTTPSYITVTAHLLGITGTATFTASGATITDNHDNTATVAYDGMSGASASVTATVVSNGQTFTASVTLTKVSDGATGPTGSAGTPANQYAIAYLYQWSTATPSTPVGTSTFDWASGTNTNYVGSDSASWKLSPPTNPGAPNISLFVAAMQVSAAGGTLSSTVAYSSAVISAWAKNGATGPQGDTGASGVQAASPTVFQWAASIPSGPSGTATYTWADGTFGAAPTGWSLTAGNSPTPGMTLWAAKVQVTDIATNTTTNFNWTSAGITAVGYAGSNGGAGAQGASYVTAYCASATATTTTAPAQTTGKTSLPATNDGGIVGTWSATVPTLSSGQYMYQSDGIYDPTTNKITWSIPYWSSLKVGSLSAITTNTGNLTVSGTISSANGNFTVDAAGNATMKSASIQDGSGNVILQAGSFLADAYVPPINAAKLAVTLGGDNLMNNSGFNVQTTADTNRPNGYAAYNNAAVYTSYQSVPGRLGGKAFAIRADASGATNWGLTTSNLIADVDGTTGGVTGGWQPNKTYVLSYKARKVNGAGLTTMGLRWNTAPAAVTEVSNPTLTTSWQTYTFRIEWGPAVEGAGQVFVDHNGAIAIDDELHIDELIVQEGDVASEWFPSPRDAMTAVALIGSDNMLSKGEKSAVIADWAAISGELSDLQGQANSLGVDHSTLDTAFTSLGAYLSGLSPAWNDPSTDTPVVGDTFRTKFSDYYVAKQSLVSAMAAKAATMASGVTIGANGALNGAGGGQVTLPGMGHNTYRVITQGSSRTAELPDSVGLYINGALQSGTNIARSYTVLVFSRSNGSAVSYTNYDVYGVGQTNGLSAANMAADLNALGPDKLVVVLSFDEPRAHRLDSGLDTAMYRCGASRSIYGSSQFKSRSAYALVGIPGCGEGNGAEAYQGAVDNDPNAWVDVSFGLVNGVLSGVSTNYKPLSLVDYGYTGDLNATNGATIGTNLSGQITSGNSSTYIGNQAINSVHISDLRTTNYAEDGSGNPTAGGKLASTGTAFKVASNSMQVGTLVLSDYWFRLIQGVDGNQSNNRIIWRGNNDATTRGGAPNIACLSVTPSNSYTVQFDSSNGIQLAFHKYTITPTSYSTNTDNLDAIQQIHVQFFAASTSAAPFTEFYQACPSRTYDGASGISKGNWFWGWPYITPAADGRPDILLVGSGATLVYSGYLRIRLANTYGWSATQDFSPGINMTTALTTTTITGVAGSSGGGSGSQGGACPAPWVKVKLLNGKEVNAGDLHNGAKLAAVNDSTMEAIPQGGTVRDIATIWAQRYRVKLTDGTATEWSENHRFAIVDRGWVQVQNLRAGDQIMGLKENVVESVLAMGQGQVVSFRVEGAGTYFAGGLLCHNTKTIT